MQEDEIKALLRNCYEAAVQSVMPEQSMAAFLPEPPKGHTYVIGAGKAAAKMAQIFEELWNTSYSGVVVTRHGQKLPTKKIKVLEAAHPVPDENSASAAQEILDSLKSVTADDLVICLLSGGGSSLLTCPQDVIKFNDLQSLNKALLHSGADIYEMNIVRKHVNKCFGGKLAAAAMPARLVTLSISDVVGDDPATIASGPTYADPSTLADAVAVLNKYEIEVAPSILKHLQNPENETVKPNDPIFDQCDYRLIATPRKLIETAKKYLEKQGFDSYILSDSLTGDTNEAAAFHAALAKQVSEHKHPFKTPCVLISGGETTVKMTGQGEGGPNSQFILASALALGGVDTIYALACDTDGVDGSKDVAGAILTPETLARAHDLGLNPKTMLEDNDSYHFFKALDDLVITGPTHTNVNDLRLFLIL